MGGGDVVAPTTNIDGCAAFSADEAAKIAGKVVWFELASPEPPQKA